MHEMQTIVTDDRSVYQSVTRLNAASLCKNGSAHQDAVQVNALGGPLY